MDTRKMISRKLMVGMILLVLTLVASSAVWAGGNCQRFSLTSNIQLLGPNGPAVGTAVIMLESGAVVEVNAVGEIVSSKVSEEGIIHMRVREVDDWGALGTTIGLDRLKLTPTAVPGEFDMTIKTFIVGESGALADIHGRYKGAGTVSFNTGMLTHAGSGKVCNLPF